MFLRYCFLKKARKKWDEKCRKWDITSSSITVTTRTSATASAFIYPSKINQDALINICCMVGYSCIAFNYLSVLHLSLSKNTRFITLLQKLYPLIFLNKYSEDPFIFVVLRTHSVLADEGDRWILSGFCYQLNTNVMYISLPIILVLILTVDKIRRCYAYCKASDFQTTNLCAKHDCERWHTWIYR